MIARTILDKENKENDEIHILPDFEGEKKHEASVKCWCEPEIVEVVNGRKIWVHKREQ